MDGVREIFSGARIAKKAILENLDRVLVAAP